jgi:predicted NAD-dependent protein-ADP-ribosyltransferase YbiA (DUF1768 family)
VFIQHEDLRTQLLATGDAKIVAHREQLRRDGDQKLLE